MQVKLITDGGYCGIPVEAFGKPVEVHDESENGNVGILGAELIRIGADPEAFDEDYPYHFFINSEVERV